MGVRKLKPVTNGTRHAVVYDFSEITKKEPEKSLVVWWHRAKGRSRQQGKITSRHRGGGHKKLYRIIASYPFYTTLMGKRGIYSGLKTLRSVIRSCQ